MAVILSVSIVCIYFTVQIEQQKANQVKRKGMKEKTIESKKMAKAK